MVRRVIAVRLTRLSWLLVAAAAPAVVLASLEAAMLMIATVRDHPRWPNTELNLSEAAAVRDHAEVVRLIESGENPNTRRPVRPGLVQNDVEVEATPLEAAIAIRRPELVSLLFDRGARLSPADWLRLWCSAQAQEYAGVAAVLDTRRPDGVEIRCSGDESLW